MPDSSLESNQLQRYFQDFTSFLKTGNEEDLDAYLEGENANHLKFFKIYRNGFLKSGVDVLKNTYPVTQNVLGEQAFSELSRSYVQQHPSHQRTLVGYGEPLAKYLEQHTQVPYIRDIANLDRAWLNTLNAPDVSPITSENISNIANSGMDISELHLIPCEYVSILKTQYQLFELWVQLKSGHSLSEKIELEPSAQTILFWKESMTVRAIPINEGEQLFLQALYKGQLLGEAAAEVEHQVPDADMAEIFANFLLRGLLTINKRD